MSSKTTDAEDCGSSSCLSAPAGWYHVDSLAKVARGPVGFDFPSGQRFVAFAAKGGKPAVMDARCSHMGADLARGSVVDGCLVCPLHGWAYAGDGTCQHIPATPEIPALARQRCFPVAARGPHLFFFNRREANFDLPFFGGVDEHSVVAARPFEFTVEVPWYLVSANGFDGQHFRSAHDRTLRGEPVFDKPHPHAWRMQAEFEVTGRSLLDRLTRRLSGPVVRMTVESWGGLLILVSAQFQRTTTYGLVSLTPLDDGRTRLRNIVWMPRSRRAAGRWLLDPLNAWVRRYFIRAFVHSDVHRSAGIRLRPGRMIPADKVLVEYLQWLQKRHGCLASLRL